LCVESGGEEIEVTTPADTTKSIQSHKEAVMQPTETDGSSKNATLVGRILTVLAALFMLMDGIMKLVKPAAVLEANVRLGYPISTLSGIGLVLIACSVLYVIPRTSLFGALLLTGYFGGAVASNVRAGSGWFETMFPALFAVLVWGGLWLREQRLQNLLSNKHTDLVTAS
jgi:hypothetical protein